MSENTMRTALTATIALALLLSLAIAVATLWPRDQTSNPAATGDDATSQTAVPEESEMAENDASTGSEGPELTELALPYLKTLTAVAEDPAQLEELREDSAPELYASLVTSDHDALAELGTEVLELGDGYVVIGTGSRADGELHFQSVPASHGGPEDLVINGIVLYDPEPSTALPVNGGTPDELRDRLHTAATSLIGQTAETTDEDRREMIALTFIEPTQAAQIPRVATEGTAVTVGSIHDLELASDESDQLTATVTVPWESTPGQTEWASLTFTLDRTADGHWQARDAV